MIYKAKPIVPVDAVLWNGEDFTAVQVVCPQAVRMGTNTTISIPGPIEVYPGEMVLRELDSGNVGKMAANIFSVLYESQTL